MKRSETIDMFVADIESRIKSFYGDMIDAIQTHHVTLDQTYKLNEEITDKMEAIYNHMRTVLNHVKENDMQLMSAMNPSLENAQQFQLKANQEVMHAIRAHATLLNDRQVNLEQEKFASNCKMAMASVLKLIQENVSSGENEQRKISENNNVASKAAAEQFASVESSISEKTLILTKNEVTTKLLDDFNNGNVYNSGQHGEQNSLINDIISAEQKFSGDIHKGIDSCVKNLKYFCNVDFCPYPNGKNGFFLYK